MFLSEGVLSSNISNMNIMNIFSFFSACLPVCVTMLHVMVFTCVQFYNLPHIETTTGNYGSITAVCAGTALKNILNSNLIYLRKRS